MVINEFGTKNDYGKLRSVIVNNPPTSVIFGLIEPEKYLFDCKSFSFVEATKIYYEMQKEHENLIEILLKLNVKTINLLNIEEYILPNRYFVKDYGKFIDNGFILSNFKEKIRKKEREVILNLLKQDNIPILNKHIRNFSIEGGDLAYFDNNTMIFGIGKRTNGCFLNNFESVINKKIFKLKIPDKIFPLGRPDYIHLDEGYCRVDENRAIVHQEYAKTYITNEKCFKKFENFLKEKDIKIGKIYLNEENNRGANVVVLERGIILAPKEAHESNERLKKEKIIDDYIEVPIKYLSLGGGGISCMILPILREF
jgi:N-dimethylarginine dimethylaminohydrolase